MILISEGPFLMGQGKQAPLGPQRLVTLSAYYIDRTEVTVGDYRRCVRLGGCRWNPSNPSPLFFNDNQPMVLVSWFEAKEFCRWAHKRLPTEAEWEKAARGADGAAYPWGNEYTPNFANLWDVTKAPVDLQRYRFTWPVGAAQGDMSPYRVQDMAGNVAEWTADSYHRNYHTATPDRDPAIGDAGYDPEGRQLRTVRGGSFIHDPESAALYRRDGQRSAASRGLRLGFRCARDLH
ncbi:MAG: formylglycine-generating enzyme family protein [Alphaproteobacteria bacterium]